MADTNTSKPTRLLPLLVVRERTTLSKAGIYRAIQEGSFPKPVRLGSQRRVAWTESSIDQWIADCAAASQAA
jgi:prophage regulatory protein